jgi:hypothetical protein
MKTASWFTYKGLGRIGISQGTPRFAPAGYRKFITLAPDRAWMHEPLDVYEPLYRAKLAALDPRKTWDELHKLAGDAEPVLLCFEKPPFIGANFCHRRMVASWFTDTLGHHVPEFDASAALAA